MEIVEKEEQSRYDFANIDVRKAEGSSGAMIRPSFNSIPKFKWWEVDQLSLDYDEETLGFRPVNQTWPEGSVLTRDHFTIDQQHCLKCRKKLGYAMPMNKPANPKYLFCCDKDGNEKCRENISFLNCHACGNLNNESTLHVVSKPGNCAYTEATCIYDVMCFHCHKDMMENEPGVEECKKQMKEIRKMRKQDELDSRLGGGGLRRALNQPGGIQMEPPERYISSLGDRGEDKRKRKRGGEKEEADEDEGQQLSILNESCMEE